MVQIFVLDQYTHEYNSWLSKSFLWKLSAGITVEENAATVQRILDEYNRMNPEPVHRKDMNYSFPPDLFSSEVNLEGSQQAYQNILTELENPEEFQKLFIQVEADPLRPQNMFHDIDLDIFDWWKNSRVRLCVW